jgi:thymidylate synthase (FAD)
MKIQTYNDITIDVLRQTENPAMIVGLGLQNCMKKDVQFDKPVSRKQIEFLLSADHMSPLEQASMTIQVSNMSRALLAQVTRHRTSKFSSSSQHYQDYSDYPFIISPKSLGNAEKSNLYALAFEHALNTYRRLIEIGEPKEEARQVLPNASAVNLLITADARNMVNFFKQRLCYRNTLEMLTFANKWHLVACKWFPELFNIIGRPCLLTNKCTQGHMKAKVCGGANE